MPACLYGVCIGNSCDTHNDYAYKQQFIKTGTKT